MSEVLQILKLLHIRLIFLVKLSCTWLGLMHFEACEIICTETYATRPLVGAILLSSHLEACWESFPLPISREFVAAVPRTPAEKRLFFLRRVYPF